MRGHAHTWTYTSPTKRVCDCDAVEVLTPPGDWVPVEWAIKHMAWKAAS